MAEKKYIDLTGLTHYDEKIKAAIDAKDAAALKAAKDYADSLADNYDAAGVAETKVNELANGQVKTNTEAIAKLNGGADAEGSVAKAVADAKAEVAAAAAAADAKAVAAQGAADDAKAAAAAVDKKIGEVPEGSTVMAQIQAVKDASYDDTEVRGLIRTNADDIDALEGRADAVEGKVTTLIGADASKSVRTIANEELTKQLIPDNANESLDTLQEIAQWIQAHPADASAMNKAIEALKTKVGDIPEDATADTIVGYIKEIVGAEQTRATAAEGGLDTRVKAVEAKLGDGDGSVTAQIAAAVKVETDARVAADKTLDGKVATAQAAAEAAQGDVDALETVVAGKAAASDVTALTTRVDTAEKDIDDLQAAIGADGSVTAAIAEAKKAGTDAQATANQNKTDITALTGRVGTNETNISAHGDRLTKLETKVGDGFIAITNEEIDGLFA